MSEEISALEESVKDILIDLMNKRVMFERLMYVGVQVSSTRGVQASSSTTHRAGPSRPSVEKRTKHRDDLANVKLIPTILLDYIPPLAGVVSQDNMLRYFEYPMVTMYLPKRIHVVQA
jgi:hypothetical protein